jgi:hypothetical protein
LISLSRRLPLRDANLDGGNRNGGFILRIFARSPNSLSCGW